MQDKPTYEELASRVKALEAECAKHKTADEALEVQNRLMNTLLDNLQVGVFMLDATTGKPLLANKRAMELLGRGILAADKDNLAEVYAAYVSGSDTLYPRDRMPVVRGLYGAHHYVDDLEVEHPDGRRVLLEIYGSPVRDGQGNVVASLVSFADITDRRKTERELAQIFQMSLDMICIADIRTATFRKVNRAFTDTLGFSEEELLGKPFLEFIHPDDVAPTRKVIDDELKKGVKVINFKNRYRCKDGTYRWLNWVSHPIAEEGLTYAVAHDVTEEKKMEQQLHQKLKFESIGTLAGGIAHDFNNLMMGIMGRNSLMSAGVDASHPHREHIRAIEEYIRSAMELTQQLLGFARGGKYEVKPVAVNELLLNSSKMFGRTKKEIQIHTKFDPSNPVVEADQGQLEQVFLNIYVNAWQAMPKGGQLYLETKTMTVGESYGASRQIPPGRYVIVSITDTGVGMDETVRKRIFDPFFSTKTKSRGTGLGLASAYGIVKNHNGTITVYSEVGYGSTFDIYLPLSEKEVCPMKAIVDESILPGSEVILLVDDEDMIIDVGKDMLESLGYQVMTAKEGRDAVEMVRQMGTRIKLVILDLVMPKMDGGEIFNRIRELHPHMPVLLSSGYAMGNETNDLLQKGCNGFIQKPFNLNEISLKIREVLDE